jgi:predicted nucleotidyltransferase
MSAELPKLLERAASELKAAGATEVYAFGSASTGTAGLTSDIDLAVSGLPPSIFYRMAAQLSESLGRSVDLVDLDRTTPFTSYLRQENELIRLG